MRESKKLIIKDSGTPKKKKEKNHVKAIFLLIAPIRAMRGKDNIGKDERRGTIELKPAKKKKMRSQP